MSSVRIVRAGIGGQIEANNAQAKGRIDGMNQRIQHIRGVFCACTGLSGLVPDDVDALIHAITMAQRLDLLNGVSLAIVNGDGTDRLHLVQAIRYVVHDIDFRSMALYAPIPRTGPAPDTTTPSPS